MATISMDLPEDDSLLSAAWKRIRAQGQHLFELDGKVERMKQTIQDIGQPLEMRGPDPDSEEQRYTQEEVRFLMGAAVQEARRNYGGIHKDGNGSNINTLLLALLTVVVIPGGAWIISTLIDHGQQLAQIRCQLNPSSCLQLQVPHVP